MIREAALVLADGSVFEGELLGAEPPDGVASGEVVFNTVLTRLPGGHHRPVVRRPDHHLHLPAHRQLRRQRRPTSSRVGRSAAASIVREIARRHSNHRAEASLDAMLQPLRHQRHRRDRHAPADPAAARHRGDARRVRHRRMTASLRAAAAAEPGTDGIDLVAEVTTAEPYSVGDGDRPSIVAYDFGIKHTILRHLVALGTRRRRAGVTRPPPTCWPCSPTASSSPTAPATRPRSATRSTRSRELLGERADLRHLPRPSAAQPGPRRRDLQAARSATTAATTRCATRPTGQVEITSQNHNFCVDADSLARQRRRSPTSTSTTATIEGHARATASPAFSVQYHPEAGPGPHDARYLFDDVRRR